MALSAATDYYPFGMPMPNRQIVGGEQYRYSYQGEFAETDPETGKQSFEKRLYDTRIGRWLRPDDIRRFNESSYLGMGNNPILYSDADGRDIIILTSSKAAKYQGHAAVLIGDDKNGWRYVSKNGTIDHSFNGESYNPNVGKGKYSFDDNTGDDFRGTGLTAKQVISIINSNHREKNNLPKYDLASRISSHPVDDYRAFKAVVKEAKSDYLLIGSSCLDICKIATKKVNNGYGAKRRLIIPKTVVPNLWHNRLNAFNMFNAFYSEIRIPKASIKVGELKMIGIEE